MAVYLPHQVSCVCGKVLTVQLADSINVKRSPDSRDRILRGEMHRAVCSDCGREMTVEKPFYYTDLTRNVLYKVCPRGERHQWKDASRDVDRASSLIPGHIVKANGRKLRVVFGMDELREKLVAEDANIDDRVLELLKVLLVYEHPILLRRPRLRLALTEVTTTDLEFRAAYEHDQKRFRLRMPRSVADELANDPEKLETWTRKSHKTCLFDLPDHWVNMWRWSPQPTALDRLQNCAAAIRNGELIDLASPEFNQMLIGLPRGNHLPSWAKRDLRTLYEYIKQQGNSTLEDRLFEIRFGFELENDWSTNNDPHDIDTLWKLLKDLPDTHVEGNTKIDELLLEPGGGGWYDPRSHDIAIGSAELLNRERFEDVVLHEIGHAVHEMLDQRINSWLAERFGWQIFVANDAGIDAWVSLMGGWGPLTAGERRDVRYALLTALGHGSSWSPGPTPSLPNGHPWYHSGFGPRLAFENTGANWYNNFPRWHRAEGKAFFLNYWYRTFMAVDVATLELIAQMPSSYAAMSHFEFFAELYALYYDAEDEMRGAIPFDVREWLEANIGAPEPAAPMPASPSSKHEFETIRRPK